MADRIRLSHVTKGLYQDVARRFRTSWQNVGRNIRSVRDTIWENGERELLMETSRGRIKKRPANTELLQFLTDYLLDQKELEAQKESAATSIVARIAAPHKAVRLLHDLIWKLMNSSKKE